MKTAMFVTPKELAKFMAKPQDVSYVGQAYEIASNYFIKFHVNGMTSLSIIANRISACGGVLLEK